jgi:hypothetical protein
LQQVAFWIQQYVGVTEENLDLALAFAKFIQANQFILITIC